MGSEKSVFIVSGEESGDIHGAALMASLRELMPSVRICGMGGERMLGAGLDGLDSREISVVGVVEVIEKLASILRAFRALKHRLATESFDAVVLIDFPDFNLRVARVAHKLGIPVIYYISPQVWAWRKGRIHRIARLVDKMLVVFPFEVEMYEEAGVDVEYVGHPLADVAGCEMSSEQARASFGIMPEKRVVALLPGSRSGEVARMLGPMIEAAGKIDEAMGERTVFLLCAAASIPNESIGRFVERSSLDVRVVRGRLYPALRASDAALAASGTATLECALIGTPMVIVYKMAALSYGIARALIGMEHVGLPNIVAGRAVVPELIQSEATPEKMAQRIVAILTDDAMREEMTDGLRAVRERLGSGGASERAALAIKRLLERRGPERTAETGTQGL